MRLLSPVSLDNVHSFILTSDPPRWLRWQLGGGCSASVSFFSLSKSSELSFQHHRRGRDMGSGVGGCSVGRTFPVLPQHVPSWAAWSLEPLSLPAWSWGALLLLSCLLLREVSPHFLNHREPRQGPLAGHMFRLAAAVPSRSSVSLAHLRRGGEEARVLLPQSSFHLSFCPQGGFLLCFLVAALQWTLTSRVPGGRVGLP